MLGKGERQQDEYKALLKVIWLSQTGTNITN